MGRQGIRRLIFILLLLTHSVFAGKLDGQRADFHEAEQAIIKGHFNDVRHRMPALKTYPLYPYLEYQLLRHDLAQVSVADVKKFIDTYPGLPMASSLKNIFINELARRQDWPGIVRLSPSLPSSSISRCHWFQAKLKTGATEQAWQGAEQIWLIGRNTPAACRPLFDQWRAQGLLTPDKQLQRIILAYQARNSTLVKSLLADLPADYGTIKRQLILLLNQPRNLAQFARSASPTAFNREITIHGFRQLARLDAQQARELIPEISRTQKFSPSQQQLLKEMIAWQWMDKNLAPDQKLWRDEVIILSNSEALKERRLRLALSENDYREVKHWLARLPNAAKQKQEWRYWQAVLLEEAEKTEEAKAILSSLASERGFYPMVAAQRLNIDYIIKPSDENSEAITLPDHPALQRVTELKYWQKNQDARAEWLNLLAWSTAGQKRALVDYALERKWWDLAILATIKAKMWDSIAKRFPLAYHSLYQDYARGKLISQSYAMAIARQESGLDPEIRSSAGAIGLMQLMPATAKHTAQKFAISNYNRTQQLRDPATNIQLGMQYLDFVYKKFDQNRILASAAYNAGPSRVQSWLQQTQGQLDAVAFIETLPFKETRNYVKYVLTYDGYYQFLLGHPRPIFTNKEWNRKY